VVLEENKSYRPISKKEIYKRAEVLTRADSSELLSYQLFAQPYLGSKLASNFAIDLFYSTVHTCLVYHYFSVSSNAYYILGYMCGKGSNQSIHLDDHPICVPESSKGLEALCLA